MRRRKELVRDVLGIGGFVVAVSATLLLVLPESIGWLLFGLSTGLTVAAALCAYLFVRDTATPIHYTEELQALVKKVEHGRNEVARRQGLVERVEREQPASSSIGFDPKAFANSTDELIDQRVMLEQARTTLATHKRELLMARQLLRVQASSPSEARLHELREELALVQVAINEAQANRVVAFSRIHALDPRGGRSRGAGIRSEVQMWDDIRANRERLYAQLKASVDTDETSI